MAKTQNETHHEPVSERTHFAHGLLETECGYKIEDLERGAMLRTSPYPSEIDCLDCLRSARDGARIEWDDALDAVDIAHELHRRYQSVLEAAERRVLA